MSGEPIDVERLQKERDYYNRKVDELAGENLKLDYLAAGLRHELGQKRKGFALLAELQQSIGAHQQISSIFEITMSAINATLGMDKTVVLTSTQEEHHFRPAQWLGFHEEAAEQLAGIVLDFPADFAGGRGLLLVNRATAKTPLIEQIGVLFEMPFFICLPVMGENGPIALLLSGRLKEARPFYPPLDQGDVDTFSAIAGLISASVRNMRVAVLEEMDRLKTDFFANISHEFRTPIALTLGPLEQILAGRRGPMPEFLRGPLHMMARNQERLLVLVNQILDLAKLEAGGMQLRAAPMPNLNAFVSERTRQFQAAAKERGLMLRLSLDFAADGADLYVDREKLDKLLFNLLSNAVKFTQQGAIDVSTEIVDGAIRLSVADTGIGIKEDQLPHVFDRFRQADGSVSREYAGTGIGLAIVKENARLHGGDVAVHSQYGKGTTFRVTIPLGKAHLNPSWVTEATEDEPAALVGGETTSAAMIQVPRFRVVEEGAADRSDVAEINRAAAAARDAERQTILYAEDNADLRQHVRELLAPAYNVFLAVDGRDALQRTREYRPDLVLSDVMMPGLGGRELLRELRADPSLHDIPVLFLTARAGTDAMVESLDSGADDYLQKPFNEAELLARVRNVMRAHARERELKQLNHRLETATRHKSEFLANMSHELRTPLNAIIGFTRIVQRRTRDYIPEKQAENLEKVLISGEHLLALINDILDLSKIEAGRIEVQPSRFQLPPVLDLCVETVEPLIKGERLRLSKRIESDLPALLTDQERLKQILINLLSNAVKFTEGGSVTVTARHVPADNGDTGDGQVAIAVADTGIGIPAEKHELIFEEFRQVDNSTTRAYSGTGLGLSISRRLARLMGGEITVASIPGRGSTFTVTLPVRYEAQP
jgi:signal transduction histidine kinase